jgi:hypothetical protein
LNRRSLTLLPLNLFLLLIGCSQSPSNTPAFEKPSCAGLSSTRLVYYDNALNSALDDETRHPTDNASGAVVWNTRYYMESLLAAYEATHNPKYIQAFVDTGTWVMKLVQTIQIVDAPDPSAPGAGLNAPLLAVTGWPTQLGSFGIPVAIPTQTGQVAFYAQDLNDAGEVVYVQISSESDGSLTLQWLGLEGQVLESDTIHNLSDLSSLAGKPLIEGESYVRIKATGLGLPVPGQYLVVTPEQTVWHLQTGGILLPFAHFLVLVKDTPGLADPSTVTEWTSKILSIASSYEDEFIPDGHGGLRFHVPYWIPNTDADTDSAADYIAAEATFRLFLYEATKDTHQLSIAQGLAFHEADMHWSISSRGYLELKFWPDFVPWSTKAEAPAGSIWDQFEFDPTTPAPGTDASFMVDLLHYAKTYRVAAQFGFTDSIYAAQLKGFDEYLSSVSGTPIYGPHGTLRAGYPNDNSSGSDSAGPPADPFAASAFLTPDVADPVFVNTNWNWMLEYEQQFTPGFPNGYFLRAWARSEAAELSTCKADKTTAANAP